MEIKFTTDFLSNFTCWPLVSRELNFEIKKGDPDIRLGAERTIQ